MRLYLVQHAEACREEEDPKRPLTSKGRQDIEKVSGYVTRYIQVKTIFHSGKTRARQTAEILSKYINPTDGIKEIDGLEPSAEPSVWASRIKDIKDDIMIVGHLPHLCKLSALILCGDDKKKLIDFQMGGVVCLEKDQEGVWSIKWIVMPQVLV